MIPGISGVPGLAAIVDKAIFVEAVGAFVGDEPASQSFSSVPFGSASPERVIIMMVSFSQDCDLVSATIGGVAATITKLGQPLYKTDHRESWVAAARVPAGTSGAVTLTTNKPSKDKYVVSVYRAYNGALKSLVPTHAKVFGTGASVTSRDMSQYALHGGAITADLFKERDSSVTWGGVDAGDSASQSPTGAAYHLFRGAKSDVQTFSTSLTTSWGNGGSAALIAASWR